MDVTSCVLLGLTMAVNTLWPSDGVDVPLSRRKRTDVSAPSDVAIDLITERCRISATP